MKAIHDKLILKAAEKEQESFIVVPDMGKEIPERLEVVDIGPGRTTEFGTTIKCQCNVGDIVMVPKAVLYKITDGDEEYFVCRDNEVLVIIK